MAPSKEPLLPPSPSRGDARSKFGAHEFDRAYEESEQIDVYQNDEAEDQDVEGEGGLDHVPKFSWKKLWMFMGPGFLMSIAYLDPGNIESDIQAGAAAGYSLLWLLLWATVMGLLIQLLAARLGVATGRHLAELCREEYPRWSMILLWLMTEVAIIGADIQEVIGSAIAIRILSNGYVPLWIGVLITGFDGFLFLSLESFGVRKLEALFGFFIAAMAISFAWMFGKAQPDGTKILRGLVIPTVPSRSVDIAVGIVGCVIMPHNIFLHSALVQSRIVDTNKKSRVWDALRYYTIESGLALLISFIINLFIMSVFAKGFYKRGAERPEIGIMNAGEYLQREYGGGHFPILYIWAVGLLMAGQSSTLTGTYTGQFVMAGFLSIRVKKWLRVTVTRSVSIIPTVVMALIFDEAGNDLDRVNEWLNVLQSVQLPFALIPLFCLVSNKRVMGSFRIGTITKVITAIISVLVVIINFYLLGVFFLSSVIQGLPTYTTLVVAAILYVAFLIYLALQPSQSDGLWAVIKERSSRKPELS